MVPGRSVFAHMSFAPAGNSWRKPTRRRYRYGGQARHVEMVGRQAGFLAQSSVLITQSLFSLKPDTYLGPAARSKWPGASSQRRGAKLLILL